MTFFAFGINYQTAPLDVRGAFSLSEEAQRALYRGLSLSSGAELILVSTCNRTEAYLFGTESDLVLVQERIAATAGQAWPEAHAFRYQDEDAVRHVLEVTSGLRSLVLGDAQILAQVKDAYRVAVEEECVNTVLHRLVHSAFRAAKRVAAETALSSGAASVSSAAVAMARSYFEEAGREGLDGRRVLLVGTGQMGRLALHALSRYELASLSVTNRSRERAEMVAEVAGAAVVAWEDRHGAASRADLVIVATGAAEPVLRADAFQPKASPTLLVDISVPPNVDPAISETAGYDVLSLDALQAWTQGVERSRRAEVPRAEAICDEVLAEFVTWMFHQQALQPVIETIRSTFDDIRLQEIERYQHRFTGSDAAEVDRLTRSIMQKLLAIPIVRLKSVDPESIDFVRGIRLLQHLFSRPGCEEAEAPSAPLKAIMGEAAPCGAAPRSGCPLHDTDEAEMDRDVLSALAVLQAAQEKRAQA